jgi:hypothetical protein
MSILIFVVVTVVCDDNEAVGKRPQVLLYEISRETRIITGPLFGEY